MSEHEYWARVRDMVRTGHDDDRPKADRMTGGLLAILTIALIASALARGGAS